MPLIGQPTTVTADHLCDPKNDADVIAARQQGKLTKGVVWQCPVCERTYRFVPEEWTKIVPRRRRSEDAPAVAETQPAENETPAVGESQPAPEGDKIEPSSEAASSEPESESSAEDFKAQHPSRTGDVKRSSTRR